MQPSPPDDTTMAPQSAARPQQPPIPTAAADTQPAPLPIRPLRRGEQHFGLLAGVVLAHGALLVLSQLGAPPAPQEPPPIQVALITPPAPKPVAPTPELPRPKPPEIRKAVTPRPAPVQPRPVVAQPTATSPLSESATALTAPAPAASSPVAAEPAKAAEAAPAPFVPVNVNAAYLANPAPPYPPLSKRLREQGKVDLRVRVSADGLAEHVEIKTSSGLPRLDNAALEAVQRWRFTPARQGERSVASTVVVPIIFKLEES